MSCYVFFFIDTLHDFYYISYLQNMEGRLEELDERRNATYVQRITREQSLSTSLSEAENRVQRLHVSSDWQ